MSASPHTGYLRVAQADSVRISTICGTQTVNGVSRTCLEPFCPVRWIAKDQRANGPPAIDGNCWRVRD